MRIFWRFALVLCPLLAGTFGCTADDEWQDPFKEIWVLESRVLPDGREIRPPQISGRMEWFPTDPSHAHLSFLTTYDPESVQVQGDHIAIHGTDSYDRLTYMKINGGLSQHYTEGVSTEYRSTSGTITEEGEKWTWSDGEGLTMVFEEDLLEIRHPDGTVDTLTQ